MKYNLNPFNEPKKYRDIILKNNLIPFPKKQFSGKSLACLFLTRFCSVGCPFCFYKSAPAWRKRNIEDQFSDEGVHKFIEFSKSANLGYLLISGGGEPLNQRKHILEIVKKVEVDRIVLVTSGNWAKNFHAAINYIDAIYQAMKEREKTATVVIRLSVSVGHNAKMGLDPAKNLIKIFRDKFSFENNFLLQIKTFEDDPTLGKVLNEIEGFEVDKKLETLESDNHILIKKIPKKYKITFKEGLKVNVGVSKIFHSTLQADLNDKKFVDCSTKVFEEDISDAEDNNPAVVFNPSGDYGIDWSINYNGDICTWQNQVRDNYLNLYEDSYEDIFSANFNDPVTYSFIDKGRHYREKIVSEVNERAVVRMRAIALRDTSGAIIFEEEHTRLYFSVRVLQDYIEQGDITKDIIASWPEQIRLLVLTNKDRLKELYGESDFSIIKQQMSRRFNEQEWLDLFYLIKLNHYKLSESQIKDGLKYFNSLSSTKLDEVSIVMPESGDIERRLTERVMHIKPIGKVISEKNNINNPDLEINKEPLLEH